MLKKKPIEYDIKYLEGLIKNGVGENSGLEFKAAAALSTTKEKKMEITKDVSAIANSKGGILIYGIKENKEKTFAESIDYVDSVSFNEEWLQQIISRISPKVEVKIHPVRNRDIFNEVVYVIEISKGETAHQALDKKYHRRYGTITGAMDDYEIRDISNRMKHPKLELNITIVNTRIKTKGNEIEIPNLIRKTERTEKKYTTLKFEIVNIGNILAKYVNVFVELPLCLFDHKDETGRTKKFTGSNVHEGLSFMPLLPKLASTISIKTPKLDTYYYDCIIPLKWSIYADNAAVAQGEILASNLKKENLNIDY